MESLDLISFSLQLTPQYLGDVVRRLAASQSVGDRDAVSITPLINALTGGLDFGHGKEGWQTYLHIKQMIKDATALIPDMRYVEGDS